MIYIQIDEKRMKEILSECFESNIEKILQADNLEYWIRNEVHQLLAKELFEKTLKPMLTNEKINQLLKSSFDRYVEEKFNAD